MSLIYEGILPSKSPPKFTNLVTMMHPNDNMVNIVMGVVEFHSVTSEIQLKFPSKCSPSKDFLTASKTILLW